jgi:hypothetical protein
LIASGGNTLYTSTNSGTAWISNTVPKAFFRAVALSADGNQMVAAGATGGIYISQTTPMPQLKLAPANSGIKLFWIVPSTNFALQQSFNLSGWTDMADTPVIDLSNLQDEVIQSPTNGSVFYRLESR